MATARLLRIKYLKNGYRISLKQQLYRPW